MENSTKNSFSRLNTRFSQEECLIKEYKSWIIGEFKRGRSILKAGDSIDIDQPWHQFGSDIPDENGRILFGKAMELLVNEDGFMKISDDGHRLELTEKGEKSL